LFLLERKRGRKKTQLIHHYIGSGFKKKKKREERRESDPLEEKKISPKLGGSGKRLTAQTNARERKGQFLKKGAARFSLVESAADG